MGDNVQVDEFVFGEYDKNKIGLSYDNKEKKAIIAVQFIKEGKIKRSML